MRQITVMLPLLFVRKLIWRFLSIFHIHVHRDLTENIIHSQYKELSTLCGGVCQLSFLLQLDGKLFTSETQGNLLEMNISDALA